MSEKHVDRLTSSPSGRTDTLSMEEIQKLSDSSLARYILKQLQFYIDEEAPPGHVQRDQDFLAAMFAEVRRQSLSLESVRSEALEWIIGWTFRHDVALSVEARNELASALRSTVRVAEGEVPHFWVGHRDKELPTEEIMRRSDELVQAVTEDYWKDAVVQWPQRFLHTKECNVHEPTLSLCSCGLETRLKDEILRLQRRAPESPAKGQPGEQVAAPQETVAESHLKPSTRPDGPAVAAPDVAAMVKRLRAVSANSLLCQEAAALIEKLGQGWIPVSERLPLDGDAIMCLVYCTGEDQPGVSVAGYDEEDGWNHRLDTGCWEPGEVTHWMPLPPPPERP